MCLYCVRLLLQSKSAMSYDANSEMMNILAHVVSKPDEIHTYISWGRMRSFEKDPPPSEQTTKLNRQVDSRIVCV
jgi:hypothetical protein